MARYIDADKFLESQIERCGGVMPIIGTCTMDNEPLSWVVEKTPTADVVEVKHGEWIYWQPDGTNHLWSCSVCGGAISTPMKFVADHIKHCEHCGAKMDGERECDNG